MISQHLAPDLQTILQFIQHSLPLRNFDSLDHFIRSLENEIVNPSSFPKAILNIRNWEYIDTAISLFECSLNTLKSDTRYLHLLVPFAKQMDAGNIKSNNNNTKIILPSKSLMMPQYSSNQMPSDQNNNSSKSDPPNTPNLTFYTLLKSLHCSTVVCSLIVKFHSLDVECMKNCPNVDTAASQSTVRLNRIFELWDSLIQRDVPSDLSQVRFFFKCDQIIINSLIPQTLDSWKSKCHSLWDFTESLALMLPPWHLLR